MTRNTAAWRPPQEHHGRVLLRESNGFEARLGLGPRVLRRPRLYRTHLGEPVTGPTGTTGAIRPEGVLGATGDMGAPLATDPTRAQGAVGGAGR